MSGITTHVLDTALGRPAAGVAVCLEMQQGDAWVVLAASRTDTDGRCRDLAQDAPAGVYRLKFATGAVFRRDAAERASIRRLQSHSSPAARRITICRCCFTATATQPTEEAKTMAKLGENRYGKSRVRLSRITRLADKHLFNEWNVGCFWKATLSPALRMPTTARFCPPTP